MTNDEASEEAVRRWGALGVARDRVSYCCPPLVHRFMVGVAHVSGNGNVSVHGEGPSWEEAFAEAASRADFLKPFMDDARALP